MISRALPVSLYNDWRLQFYWPGLSPPLTGGDYSILDVVNERLECIVDNPILYGLVPGPLRFENWEYSQLSIRTCLHGGGEPLIEVTYDIEVVKYL